jgi:hypothetical protein
MTTFTYSFSLAQRTAVEKQVLTKLLTKCVSSFGRNDDLFVGYETTTATERDLVCAGGWFAGFYFFEEPDDAYAEEAEEREPAEDVDEGPVGGLAA